jgi:hypothetical protein
MAVICSDRRVNLYRRRTVATGLANRAVFAGAAMAPGTYQIRTVPSGTAPAARAAAVSSTLSGVAVAAGNSRTIVIADAPAGARRFDRLVLSDRYLFLHECRTCFAF